jgi:hypothetical protein
MTESQPRRPRESAAKIFVFFLEKLIKIEKLIKTVPRSNPLSNILGPVALALFSKD